MLKSGDMVYRVVSVDYPEDDRPYSDRPYSWEVQAIEVVRASPSQIKLTHGFRDLHRVLYRSDTALGVVFYTSPQKAIQHFAKQVKRQIESLDNERKTAERALLWAVSNEGKAAK